MININNKKITKVGNSYFFRIPKQLINNQMIDINELYDLKIKLNKNYNCDLCKI